MQLVGEVVGELATVDGDAAGSGNEAHAGDGLLATAHGCAGNVHDNTGGDGSRSCRALGAVLGDLFGLGNLCGLVGRGGLNLSHVDSVLYVSGAY